MVGLLTLHTLPSRVTFTAIKTLQVRALVARSGAPASLRFGGITGPLLPPWYHPPLPNSSTISNTYTPHAQVVLGSVTIVIGLATGAPNVGAATGWAITGTYEAARVVIVCAMLYLHRRENIATP